jgi:tRNA-binding EMAP/Myf-like protein
VDKKDEKATLEDYLQLDIRVGRIVEAWVHPESENLYCEKIDLGDEVREIASGLQKYVDISDMSGLVCVAMNLKPKKVASKFNL